MRSMTGYGEAAAENARHGIAISVRGVNHRFLDLQLRLAEEARASEGPLRDLVGREVSRGRVEMRVEVRRLGERRVDVEVNMAVVQAAHAAVHRLVGEGLVEAGLTAGDLLRLPEAFRVEVADEGWDEDDEALILQVAGRALAQLVAGREREGASLAAVLAERLDALEGVVARLDALRPGVREELAATLHRRIAELLAGQPLDELRLSQEVALLVDRSDVSEEVARLHSHLGHFREVVRDAGPVGKRLDFLSQEIFRELNTLGAKCRNAAMTRGVLDAKVICEQLREQVQNVE
jgi:uncharacterized protein (TIGR00255 family)